jgi:hypothetical protein
MKQAIVALACCALIAPLALAQTQSKSKKETATTEETVTVTGQTITAIEEGAASYQPAKTLVIREDSSNKPGTYVLNGPGHVVDKTGAAVKTAVKPGTRVQVFFTNNGDQRVIDHVVVLD